MPRSARRHDAATIAWLGTWLPDGAAILDVGPGAGKWGKHLAPLWPAIDALEVHGPYVEDFGLRRIYRRVMVGDVRRFAFPPGGYALVVFGDVLEHLPVADAQRVVMAATASGADVLAQVPYECEQGALAGVEAERHVQADLTPENMAERFPALRLVVGDGWFGMYCTRDAT